MDKNQIQLAFLKLMIVTLAGTTWVFCAFIFATRPEQADPDRLTALVRLPASLPSGLSQAVPIFAGPSKAEPIQMKAMNLDCWDRVEMNPVPTSSRWLRLSGRSCQSDSSADSVAVKNLSNGYSATVFSSGQQLTTDFIPLIPGDNQLQIRFDQGPGVALENLFIVRRQ